MSDVPQPSASSSSSNIAAPVTDPPIVGETSLPNPTAQVAADSKKKASKRRQDDSPDVRNSKTLSYILRHGAAKEGLTMRPDGYIRLDKLLARPKLKGVDEATIDRLVAENAKQRFHIKIEPNAESGEEVKWIRANQGHSIAVEGLELEKIASASEIPTVVHGTKAGIWPLIAKEGLKRMSRTYIHCATGLFGADGVISGMRATSDIYIYINVSRAMEDGIEFVKSANGVILTKGLNGVLPPRYFDKVVKKTGEVVLLEGEQAGPIQTVTGTGSIQTVT